MKTAGLLSFSQQVVGPSGKVGRSAPISRLWYNPGMRQTKPEPDREPTAFERFVQNIAAVPKSEVAAAEETFRRDQPIKRGPKPKSKPAA